MAFKRALVVDDSKTARQSLARLLAEYDIEVAFAESGEAALAFLRHELVDAIFMDHTMPGMDGLEAVSAIKSNPRTATIPVMMYTTKEGEVYVSQARALGAVGVLPKEFNPNVLFDMLCKLGLVTDRRDPNAAPPTDTPRRRITDLADEVDQEYERRALGVSVQTLVTRILEEQHMKLRSEILASQRRFAHQVAGEILERYPPEPGDLPADTRAGNDSAATARQRMRNAAVAVLAVAVGVLGAVSWHLHRQLQGAEVEITRMDTASRNEIELLAGRSHGLSTTLEEQNAVAQARQRAAIDSVAWALNDHSLVAFDAVPFDDTAANRLTELLERLQALDFAGVITVEAHLAAYCLSRDASGMLQLAPPEQPVEACEVLGHPLGGEPGLAALQTPAFAAVVAETAEQPHLELRLTLNEQAPADVAFAADADTAGAWNRFAANQNRLRFTLTLDEPVQVVGRP